MENFEKLFPKNLYHSYVVEGSPDEIPSRLLRFLESRSEIVSHSPDVLCESYESFTIDDSYHIKEWHSQCGITKGKKICIISAKFINHEAEQTLLKIIEEPAVNTHFFLIVPDSSVLLETILSRVELVKTRSLENEVLKEDALSFINSVPKKRIEQIASIIKNNKDDSSKLKFYAISLINELENIFYQKFKKEIKNNREITKILDELMKSRKYLNTQGASVKMILENLALMI